jgi:hypothetical protein
MPKFVVYGKYLYLLLQFVEQFLFIFLFYTYFLLFFNLFVNNCHLLLSYSSFLKWLINLFSQLSNIERFF